MSAGLGREYSGEDAGSDKESSLLFLFYFFFRGSRSVSRIPHCWVRTKLVVAGFRSEDGGVHVYDAPRWIILSTWRYVVC